MLNKYTDGKKIIYVTKKAFNLLYKDKGFSLYPNLESEKANGTRKKTNSKTTKRNSAGNIRVNQNAIAKRKSANNQ